MPQYRYWSFLLDHVAPPPVTCPHLKLEDAKQAKEDLRKNGKRREQGRHRCGGGIKRFLTLSTLLLPDGASGQQLQL